MAGKVGDQIVIESEKVGLSAREGEILEVIEADFGVRYRVQWADGHESTFRPAAGSATIVEKAKKRSASRS